VVGPQAKRTVVGFLLKEKNVFTNHALKLCGLQNSTYYYKSYKKDNNEKLKERLKCLALERTRWGLPRLIALLRREGFMDNHKKIERLYNEAGLQLPKRVKHKKIRHLRLVLPAAQKRNHMWAMDFVSDKFFEGRRFRCFTLLDIYTHECLRIEVDTSIPSEKIVNILNQLKITRGLPEILICDNGPEFISQNLDFWSYQNKVQIKFIQPGKPVQNAFIESFNGKFRYECLSEHWFTSLPQARKEIEIWRLDYNHNRPHRSLNMKTPNEFANEQKTMLIN
jgi:putative transposase